MKAQGSIIIHATPEKVWPYLVEPEKVRSWSPTYQKFESVGEPHSGKGSCYYVEEKAGGPLMKYTFQAIEWDENKKLSLRMISGSGVKAYQQTLQLETVPEGSRFTFMEDVELPMGFLGKVIGTLAEGSSKATIQKMLLKLKSLIEV